MCGVLNVYEANRSVEGLLMGYSVFVEFESVEDKEKMLRFLDKNFRKWSELVGGEDYLRGPTDDVSYRGNYSRKLILGFDYSAGVEREYAHVVVEWMASMFGRLVDRDKLEEDYRKCLKPGKYRCWVYDGHELCPARVDESELVEKLKEIYIDSLGQEHGVDYIGVLVSELRRLKKLWKEENESSD